MGKRRRKKILLIDDDTSLLLTLRDFLKFEGYDVVTADSGEKGLAELESMLPDLIILDMSMPGMGGMGFLKAISSPEGKPRYPVLVLTARSGMAEYFGDVDVDGFVAKPCDPQDLLMEVGRIIFLTAEDGGKTGQEEDASRQVLLGEDDTARSKEICAALIDSGFRVDSVARGPEIIERAILSRPDIILMKLIFGNMNGDTVARVLSEMPKTQDIPVVLYDDVATGVSAEEYGVSGSNIRKLVHARDTARLVEAMRQIMG